MRMYARGWPAAAVLALIGVAGGAACEGSSELHEMQDASTPGPDAGGLGGNDAAGPADGGAPDGAGPVGPAPDGLSLVAGAISVGGEIHDVGDQALLTSTRGAYDPVGRRVLALGGQSFASQSVRAVALATGAVTRDAVGVVRWGPQQGGDLGYVDGPKGTAHFGQLEEARAYDPTTGRLYFVGVACVRVYDTAAGTLTTLAGTCGMHGTADGLGSAARFRLLRSLAIDVAKQVLYARDEVTCDVRAIDLATSQVTTPFSAPGGCTSGADANALAFDGDHTLFWVDGNRLVVGDTVTKAVTTPALTGPVTQGFAVLAYAPATKTLLAGRSTGAVASGGKPLVTVDTQSWATAEVPTTEGFVPIAYDATAQAFVIATPSSVATLKGTAVTPVAGRLDVDNPAGSADGPRTQARFSGPSDVAYDAATSTAWVVDAFNRTIRQIEIATGATTTLAGYPGASGTTDGPKGSNNFLAPMGLAFDAAKKKLYVGDVASTTGVVAGLVRQIDVVTGEVSTLVGDRTQPGGLVDGPPIAARMGRVGAFVFDAASRTLFFSDADGHAVRALDLATSTVRTLAGSAASMATPVDAIGKDAFFLGIEGLAFDPASNALYATDTYTSGDGTSLVRRIDVTTGAVTTVAGTLDRANRFVQVDGDRASGRLVAAQGITFDPARKLLYVNDWTSVRSVDPASGAIATVVGAFERVGVRTGPLARGGLRTPSGIAVVASGDVLVTDFRANVLLRAKGF